MIKTSNGYEVATTSGEYPSPEGGYGGGMSCNSVAHWFRRVGAVVWLRIPERSQVKAVRFVEELPPAE